ncbi:sulfhydrogenase subunit delta [Thiohalobacter sp. IOR34]|uniref:NADH-quinone oxidoreductase subunit B family protein n=1 Tax=Thiohalobacter sp. IOR34 TaxID=3057176 RepID=UPI0025B22830|nr:sulfhydrogenase subunit delta [Thiohalobacter sp. IOR34]WJW74421.1 sulfhydrogenase subunit delta [Thiohalobacter sp. IOR34]
MDREGEARPRIAVHKFSSCDGCQLAFLNLGEGLLALAERVEIVHFAEAGMLDETAEVDIAFVEGSLSVPADVERLRGIRARSRHLVSIGACATAGGLQALRNLAGADWLGAVYARPDYIATLDRVRPLAEEVHVDLELWGCPISTRQLLAALDDLLAGVSPRQERDALCLDCKRRGRVCTLVSRGAPCLGPVTRSGCGAICPAFGRDCYGCFGPAENANPAGLGRRLAGLGLRPAQIADRFLAINSQAEPWLGAGRDWKGRS